VVSESLDGTRVLLGEAKWSARPFDRKTLGAALSELAAKPPPPLPPRLAEARIVRALFVPETGTRPDVALLVTTEDLLGG